MSLKSLPAAFTADSDKSMSYSNISLRSRKERSRVVTNNVCNPPRLNPETIVKVAQVSVIGLCAGYFGNPESLGSFAELSYCGSVSPYLYL